MTRKGLRRLMNIFLVIWFIYKIIKSKFVLKVINWVVNTIRQRVFAPLQ